jgi:uncharacterized protein (TIGR03435 family)
MLWKSVAVGIAVVIAAPHAQAPAPATSEPAFEVASVKRNTSGDTTARYQMPPNGTVTITNATMRQIIERAYPLPGLRMASYALVVPANNPLLRGSDPLEQRAAPRFDIQGKPPEGAEPGSSRLMLRTLLADRFKLRVHMETRETPAYTLTVARDGRLGPNLRATQVDCASYDKERITNRDLESPGGADGRPICTSMFDRGSISITAGKTTVRSAGPFTRLLSTLQPYLSRPIVDNSGLTGLFEWTLTFAVIPEDPAFDTREAGLVTAIRDQLGLRLERSTTPYEVLVIDSVEMPSEN